MAYQRAYAAYQDELKRWEETCAAMTAEEQLARAATVHGPLQALPVLGAAVRRACDRGSTAAVLPQWRGSSRNLLLRPDQPRTGRRLRLLLLGLLERTANASHGSCA